MPTVSLPDRPNLAQLRRQARELQRAVRAGDPDAVAHVREHESRADASAAFPLSAAQLAIARRHGFASWPRLAAYVDMITSYTRVPDAVPELDDPAAEFLRLACLNYADDEPGRWDRARRLLAAHPEIRRAGIHQAAALADVEAVRQFVASDASLARRLGGPFRWEPLFVLAYARVDPEVDEQSVLDTARVLLEHGADPDAGYLWHGLRTPFTVLTGVFGEGELGPVRQPRHPHARALARLVLEAGADPNDGQTLYNRMFEADDDHLELLFEFGLGTGGGGPWKARLGDALDSPAEMLRGQLEWAVVHDLRARVALIVEQGGDVGAPRADGRTLTEIAARNGNRALVAYLESRGAPLRVTEPVDAFVGAALAADRAQVERLRAEHPDIVDAARAARPALIVWAAALQRTASVALLCDLGFDVNAMGRGDVPLDQPWQTALHCAVEHDDRATLDLLLARGADPDLHDVRFDAPPLGWARYFDRPELVARLEPLTTPEELGR